MNAEWVRCPDRIVFMEHDRLDRQGKVLERVGKERLEQIARTLNARDRRGQLCPIGPGHTEDNAPEDQQPPHWGYAREFKVEWDQRKQKYVLKTCWYLRREHYEAARTFPNVSPEYWPQDSLLDPISLLRRTPKLDLGQWVYGRKGQVIRYAMENPMADMSKPEDAGGHKASHDPAETGDPPAHKDRPAGHMENNEGAPEGVPPEFHEHFSKCMYHHHATGMHHKYAEMFPASPVHNAMGGGMGMAGPTSGFVPGGHTVPPGGEAVNRMSKNQDEIERTVYQRRIDELEGTVKALEQQSVDSAHERDFYALLGQGYQLNVEKEVGRTRKLRGQEYADYVTNVKENYRRVAGHSRDDLIPTRGGTYAGPQGKPDEEDERPLEQEDMLAAYEYGRQHKARTGKELSGDDLVKYAREHRGKQPVR